MEHVIEIDGITLFNTVRPIGADIEKLEVLCMYDADAGICCDVGHYGGDSLVPVPLLNLPYIAEQLGDIEELDVDDFRAYVYAFAARHDYTPAVHADRMVAKPEGVIWEHTDDDVCEPRWTARGLAWVAVDDIDDYRLADSLHELL